MQSLYTYLMLQDNARDFSFSETTLKLFLLSFKLFFKTKTNLKIMLPNVTFVKMKHLTFPKLLCISYKFLSLIITKIIFSEKKT